MRKGILKHSTEVGFTLIETIITMSLFLMAMSIFYVSFTGLPSSTNQSLTLTSLVSDIRYQQSQSMSGVPSGIVFGASSYTLTPQNTVISLDNGMEISTTFPGNTISFTKGSGDVTGYTLGQDTITITDTILSKDIVLKINKYGSSY